MFEYIYLKFFSKITNFFKYILCLFISLIFKKLSSNNIEWNYQMKLSNNNGIIYQISFTIGLECYEKFILFVSYIFVYKENCISIVFLLF
jgi:hypothetical protein